MSWQNKRVFVTGATGFIGGALALRLLEEGAHVTALARTPSKGNFLTHAGAALVQGDVTDAKRMHEVIDGFDKIFHLAAVAGTAPVRTMQAVNVEGTRHMLDAARAVGVARFVHISTISVYGYGRHGLVDETARLGPTGDIYGDTKALGEGLVRRADLPWAIVRPGQVYGPRSESWTLRMFEMSRHVVPLIDGGHGTCHPIYIDDLVDLIVRAGADERALGEIFNGTPEPPPTWRAFLGAYGQMHGHTRHLDVPGALLAPPLALLDALLPLVGRRLPLRAMARFMASQVTYSHRKARDVLGWQPHVNLAEGMRRAEAWLREAGYA